MAGATRGNWHAATSCAYRCRHRVPRLPGGTAAPSRSPQRVSASPAAPAVADASATAAPPARRLPPDSIEAPPPALESLARRRRASRGCRRRRASRSRNGRPGARRYCRPPPRPAAPDTTDYSVGADNTVIVQAAETLGHYADWSKVSAQALLSSEQAAQERNGDARPQSQNGPVKGERRAICSDAARLSPAAAGCLFCHPSDFRHRKLHGEARRIAVDHRAATRRSCRFGWWQNTTPTWISATFARGRL